MTDAPKGPLSRPAFTLIELLVTIGIIGVLIAILLPALGMVRSAGRTTACMSHLQQAGQLAALWSGAHQGYLPLDGEVSLRPGVIGEGTLPPALHDSARRRYAYMPDGEYGTSVRWRTGESPVPLIPALAGLMINTPAGVPPFLPTLNWSAIEARYPSLALFRCPDAPPREQTFPPPAFLTPSCYTLTVGWGDQTGDLSPWWTSIDYASNGAVLGFGYDASAGAQRLAGRVSGVRRPAEVVLLADGLGHSMVWPAAARDTRRGSLRSLGLLLAQQPARLPPTGTFHASLDRTRHRGRTNLLFVDGHVESLPTSPLGLDGARFFEPGAPPDGA